MKPAILALLAASAAYAQPQPPSFWERLHATVEKYIGYPYVWGSTGLKSFDCSGFVWRVNYDNGVTLKRTTARKLYFSLPPARGKQQDQFGTIVFFDNLKHCGIVNDRSTFYHAQTSKGTNLSSFDPYWRGLVCGYRRLQP